MIQPLLIPTMLCTRLFRVTTSRPVVSFMKCEMGLLRALQHAVVWYSKDNLLQFKIIYTHLILMWRLLQCQTLVLRYYLNSHEHSGSAFLIHYWSVENEWQCDQQRSNQPVELSVACAWKCVTIDFLACVHFNAVVCRFASTSKWLNYVLVGSLVRWFIHWFIGRLYYRYDKIFWRNWKYIFGFGSN